jgi:AGZA family xanthine/uracil permease-like MFS transporter
LAACLTAEIVVPRLPKIRSKTYAGPRSVKQRHPSWAAPGDVNAFFGLMLDNIADLLLMVSLMHGVFEFPTTFALTHMVPGTALGVLVGDLLFFLLALRLAKKTGRNSITSMPLGLDTPSTFGMVFFVLGPAFLSAKAALGVEAGADDTDPKLRQAAMYAWQIGICAIFASGLFKIVCAFGSNWIRRLFPRAGLLGSLASIALVLISFLPLIEVAHFPIVGLVSLGIILITLVARLEIPFRVPGALAALLVGSALYYALIAVGFYESPTLELTAADAARGLLPTDWLIAFRFEWLEVLPDSLKYLPVVIPFALATVVGGIDCTESAAAAGDEYDTNQVIGVEAVATLVAALCGGVIQTTPYIGHPAYKAMGGRAAYTLATALFVGSAGVLGYFGYFYMLIPKSTVFPILIFVGLEITAQSFLATPRRHYTAVAIACVPALAYLAILQLEGLLGLIGAASSSLPPSKVFEIHTIRVLSAGFVFTSLLWAGMLASLIDRKLFRAAMFALVAAIAAFFGVIHSPVPGAPIQFPWGIGALSAGDSAPALARRAGAMAEGSGAAASAAEASQIADYVKRTPYDYATAYAILAALFAARGHWGKQRGEVAIESDEAFEKTAAAV